MSAETNYLKDLLMGLQCQIAGLAVTHAPVYKLALDGHPTRYVVRNGTEMPTIAPLDNVPLYAFAWQTGQLVDVEAGGVVVHRSTTARVVLVYPLDNQQIPAQFSAFSDWERNADSYSFAAEKASAQLDGFAGYVELFGQVPQAQYAIYADFDVTLWLTDCPDTCAPADWQPQQGCSAGPISPPPSGLTCDTLTECPKITEIDDSISAINETVVAQGGQISALQNGVSANTAFGLATANAISGRCWEGVGEGHTLVDYSGTGGTIAPGANTAHLIKAPWRVPTVPANLYLRLGTGVAGGTGKVAIYDASGPLFNLCKGPGQVIWQQVGTFPAVVSGSIITIPLTNLPAIPYGDTIFIAVATSSGTITLGSFATANKRIVSAAGVFRSWTIAQNPANAFVADPAVTAINSVPEMWALFI